MSTHTPQDDAAARDAEPNELNEELNLLQQHVNDLTEALQRERADAQNVRRQAEVEKTQLKNYVKVQVIEELLPVIDNLELALVHEPAELADHNWVKGVVQIARQLEAKLAEIGIARIQANPGTVFDPSLHDAVSMDEASEGDQEVVAEEVRGGWQVDGTVVRPAMVKVKRG